MTSHFKLSKYQSPKTEEKDHMDKIAYASVVGSIMYAMVCTSDETWLGICNERDQQVYGKTWKDSLGGCQVDIKIPEGNNELWPEIWGIRLKRQGIGLRRWRSWNDHLDFVGCKDNKKALSGYIFTMSGTAISWRSSLQATVTLSSTAVEFIELTKRSPMDQGIFKGAHDWTEQVVKVRFTWP